MLECKDALPNTLSALLEMALTDIRKTKDEGWTINMAVWLRPDKCQACLAGAVMLQHTAPEDLTSIGRLRDGSTEIRPSNYSEAYYPKLMALEQLRVGNIRRALAALRGDKWPLAPIHLLGSCPAIYYLPDYGSNPTGWLTAAEKLVVLLKQDNL